MADNASLLTMAALLIQRMDQLADCDWGNKIEAEATREEIAKLRRIWQSVMAELDEQHRDSQKGAQRFPPRRDWRV